MSSASSVDDQPIVRRLEDFDERSGSWIERAFFNHRHAVLLGCLAVTLALGYGMTKLRLNGSFEKSIPTTHPYIQNYFKHRTDLGALGNAVRVTVEAKAGTIYSAEYLATLQKISDELFLVPAVVGGGTRALPDRVRLDLALADERRFGNGTAYLRYHPAG